MVKMSIFEPDQFIYGEFNKTHEKNRKKKNKNVIN